MGDEQLAQRLQASAPRQPQPEDFIRGDRSLEGSDSTGYTTADNLAQIEAEGVRHILGKPFDMAAVRSLITSLIGDARPKPGA